MLHHIASRASAGAETRDSDLDLPAQRRNAGLPGCDLPDLEPPDLETPEPGSPEAGSNVHPLMLPNPREADAGVWLPPKEVLWIGQPFSLPQSREPAPAGLTNSRLSQR